MVSVGVVGASGYSGLELLKLLSAHPRVRLQALFGNASSGQSIDRIHPSLKGILDHHVNAFSADAVRGIELLFLALPSGQSMQVVPEALAAGCKVIDLGGDFRLSDPDVYKKFYGHDHCAASLLSKAVYGLPEWNCDAIRDARLIANPGCYPTSILLPLLPLLKQGLLSAASVGISSYSGTSGAGKSVTASMMFGEVNESVRAYKVGTHQHIPEIDLYLSRFGTQQRFTFVPHLLPITRGIHTTVHATLRESVNPNDVAAAYECYASSDFVRVVQPDLPEIRNVQHTNFCDIGFVVDESARSLVILSAIDNLGKGAAGQAVQNMNITFGFSPTEGLPCSRKH